MELYKKVDETIDPTVAPATEEQKVVGEEIAF
jgi:hypothetical protein